ncbi:MAG: O-antigen ligase family protein, partial [Dehalococcoidia bacterium]
MHQTATYPPATPAVAYVRRAMEALWLIAAALVPLAIVPDGTMVFLDTPKVAILRAAATTVVGLWVFEWALTWRPAAGGAAATLGTRLRAWLRGGPTNWIVASALLFLLANILSAAFSPVWTVSVLGREPGRDSFSLYSVATYIVMFLAVATHLRRPEQLQRLLWVVSGAAVVASVYAIGQHFGFDPIRPLDGDVTRAQSSFGNPIFFASFLVMALPLTLAAVLPAVRKLHPTLQVSIAALPVSAQLMGITFSLSRGPWVGLGVGLAVLLVLAGIVLPRRALVTALAVIAVSVAVTAVVAAVPSSVGGNVTGSGEIVGKRVSSIYNDSVGSGLNSRLDIWKTSASLIADRPWFDLAQYPELPSSSPRLIRSVFGYGPDMFLYAFPLADDQQLDGNRHFHAHNFIVHNAVELGAVGLLATMALFGAIAAAGLGLARMARRRVFSWPMALALVGILAAMAGRFVEQLTGVAQISDLSLFWLLAGVLAAFPALARSQASPSPAPEPAAGPARRGPRSGGRLRIGAAVCLAIVLAGFVWQTNARYVHATVVAASAGVAFERGDYPLSVERLGRAIDLAPNVMVYRLNKAVALNAWQRTLDDEETQAMLLRAALVETRKIIERNPLAHKGWAEGGEYARTLARYEEDAAGEALRIHEVLTALLPAFWLPKNVLAGGYLAYDRPEK